MFQGRNFNVTLAKNLSFEQLGPDAEENNFCITQLMTTKRQCILNLIPYNKLITLSIGTDRPEQSVDPDQMTIASDLGLHCLSIIQQ